MVNFANLSGVDWHSETGVINCCPLTLGWGATRTVIGFFQLGARYMNRSSLWNSPLS